MKAPSMQGYFYGRIAKRIILEHSSYPFTPLIPRTAHRAMSSSADQLPATQCQEKLRSRSAVMEEVKAQSGRRYQLESILQDKEIPFGRGYLARQGDSRYVVKEIPQDFAARTDIYERIGEIPHIRTPKDSIPERRMLVFDHLEEDLMTLVKKDLPPTAVKQILKSALLGLSMLHEKDIVHNDIKPHNILINTSEGKDGLDIEQVQLVNLEDAFHIPSGTALCGDQVGSLMWRSPETHVGGPIKTPSDMFSFGIVCTYTMLKAVMSGWDSAKVTEDIDPLAIVLEKQMSYFVENDEITDFLCSFGRDRPFHEIFIAVWNTFGEDPKSFGKGNPRIPYELWYGPETADLSFKSLIRGLTTFNPDERLTAKQALAHEWFADV